MKKFNTVLSRTISSAIFGIVFFLVFYSRSAEPSLFVSSDGVFCIKDRGGTRPTLFISGTLRIDSGGILQNKNGRIYLHSISNDGVYLSDSTAEDYFIGNGNDTIFGTMSGASCFGNVFKKNAGNIILSANTDAYALRLDSDGVIKLSPGKTFLLKSPLADAVTGYCPVRFIDVGDGAGFFKRAISDTTGSCWYVFPLGNGTIGYQQLDVNVKSLGQSGTGTISGTLANNQTGNISIDTVYAGACNPRASFQCLGGTMWKFSGPSDYIYVTRAYGNPCGPMPSRVLRAPAGTNAWTAYVPDVVGDVALNLCEYSDWSGISDTIPGGVYRGVTADFAVAVGYESALPVRLTDLRADAIENKFIRLAWSTESETANAGFVVTRGEDGISFDSIGFVAGNNNSTVERNYFFDDARVVPNITYYYQLKQIDRDGQSENSPIVFAKIFWEAITIRVQIFDLAGREVFTAEIGEKIGESFSLETFRQSNTLPSGAYVARLWKEGGWKTVRFVQF